MAKRKINVMCYASLSRCFVFLRANAKEKNSYWTARYYSEIVGITRTMWYCKQMTEKQYNDICNVALEIRVYGKVRPRKEREAA